MGVKGLKEQNVTKIDSKQNLMQKDWTKEFEHSKISYPLSNITAHRQKGEIHIYIYISI